MPFNVILNRAREAKAACQVEKTVVSDMIVPDPQPHIKKIV